MNEALPNKASECFVYQTIEELIIKTDFCLSFICFIGVIFSSI